LINNSRVSLDVVRQEVVKVITIGLKIIKEKEECKTMPAENY
jgi:hypothetical protein